MDHVESGYGPLTFMKPVVRMSKTPPRWDRPPVPLGTDEPSWA
jgi:hypothetical protein